MPIIIKKIHPGFFLFECFYCRGLFENPSFFSAKKLKVGFFVIFRFKKGHTSKKKKIYTETIIKESFAIMKKCAGIVPVQRHHHDLYIYMLSCENIR